MPKLASLCICCLLIFAANYHFWNLTTLQEIMEDIIISDTVNLVEDSGVKSPDSTAQIVPELPKESLTEQTRTAPESPSIPSIQDATVTISVNPANGSRVRGGSNVSITFSPAAGCMCYAWDDGEKDHVDNPGASWSIPVPMGDDWKTLDIWAKSSGCPNTTGHQRFIFLVDSIVELPTLLSPANNTVVPSWTALTFSFSEPATLWLTWDSDPLNGTLMVPAGNGVHLLELNCTDRAGNSEVVHYVFTASLNLQLLQLSNNTIHQPATEIEIELSDTGNIFYSWDGGANTTFQPITLPISEGPHRLDVYGENATGYIVHQWFNFTTDSSAPTLTLLSGQVDDDELTPGEVLLVGYDEPLHELSISWREHSQYSYYSDAPALSQTLWPIPTPGGFHHLDLFSKDLAGNTFAITYTFHVLIFPKLQGLTNHSILHAGEWIDVTFTDPFGHTTAWYAWDDGSNSTYQKPVPSGSGWHNLTVFTQNQEMRWTRTQFCFQVLIALLEVSPEPTKHVRNETTIQLNWSDAPVAALYSWDGQANSSTLASLSGGEGPHHLEIWAQGQLAHWNYFRLNWTIDETALVISLSAELANNSAYPATTPISFATTEPEMLSYAEIRWDGGAVDKRWDGNLTTSIPLSPAEWHVCELRVFDEAGNEAYAKFRFASLITLFSLAPANNSWVQGSTVLNLTLSAQPSLSWYEWNGSVAKDTLDPAPVTDGIYELKIGFRGASGHWNNYTLLYHVDNVAPQPAFGGVHGLLCNGSPVKPAYLFNLSWGDGQEPSLALWSWDHGGNTTSLMAAPLTEGNHTLIWWLTDAAGNRNVSLLWVMVDNKAIANLALTSDSPRAGSEVQSGVAIRFTADEEPFLIRIRWNHLAVASGWNHITTPLDEGNHTLTVMIADEAGWWTNETGWWLVDNTPPLIMTNPSIDALISNPYRNGTALSITAANATLQYSWDRGTNHSAEYPHRDQLTVTLGLPDGLHKLALYATDRAGNVNTTVLAILVDSTPISFQFSTPGNGSTKDSSVSAIVHFAERPHTVRITWLDNAPVMEFETNFTLKVRLAKRNGWHTLTVIVSDQAANVAGQRLRIQMIDDPLMEYAIFVVAVAAIAAVLVKKAWSRGKHNTQGGGQ
ncbi:MAG: hypothetical protein ACE5OZ_00975 [Candidatus Heimdallarchaeota archaeon]